MYKEAKGMQLVDQMSLWCRY